MGSSTRRWTWLKNANGSGSDWPLEGRNVSPETLCSRPLSSLLCSTAALPGVHPLAQLLSVNQPERTVCPSTRCIADMSLQRLAARPSHSINTASSPNLSLAASTALARKASLNALTAGQDTTMVGADGREIEVGDTVDVPGGMHGVVKFIGGVRGKKGTFAGVELAKEYASRGKNGGDVEG